MSTNLMTESFASGDDDSMDTSYPSVPTDGSSVEQSFDGTVVSL
jgi:hypothetical protein